MSKWVNLRGMIVSQIENDNNLTREELIQKIEKVINDEPVIKGSEGKILLVLI